jgi:gluconolactonase
MGMSTLSFSWAACAGRARPIGRVTHAAGGAAQGENRFHPAAAGAIVYPMKHFLIPLFLPAVLLVGDLPPEGAVAPVKVADAPSYCEGVVVDHAGHVYYSVCGGKAVMRLGPDGKVTKWAEIDGPNGHKVLGDGTHLVCAAGGVYRLSADGKVTGVASKECDGKPLRGPNDLCLDTEYGGFYFTDPVGSGRNNPIGTIHYVDKAGVTHLVRGRLAYPNGIVLRPGGKVLLVGESERNRILEYPVLGPGQVGPMRVFATLPAKAGEQVENAPDGICLDEAGNLYVAHYGMRQVQVLDPSGKVIRRYPGGNLLTSNVAFAGPNRDQLYVTGSPTADGGRSGCLFRLDLHGVRGLNILPPTK